MRQLFEVVLRAADPVERAALLAVAAPATWLAGAGAEGDTAQQDADGRFAALHAIYRLATNLSLSAPLLLAVDDLHCVDRSSLRALGYLARRIGDLRVALVVALRPDEPGAPAELLDALRGEPGAVRVDLRALGPASVTAIVRDALPGAADALCVACLTASAGNPSYLRELLRALAGDGQADDVAVVAEETSIPALGDRVGRWLARIGPDANALARAMAVLDDGGRLDDAAVLAGLDEVVAATVAGRMRRMEVLASEDPFAFVHPLVRRSVYAALSVADREAAHMAAARRLRDRGAAAEAIAAHLAAVRPRGSTATAGALREAAREAMAHGTPRTAARWLSRALDEGAGTPSRAVLLHELGRIELTCHEPAAIEHLQGARELATDPGLRASTTLDLAEVLIATGRWDTGVAAAAGGLEELGPGSPHPSLVLEGIVAVARALDPRWVGAFDRDRERLLALAAGDSAAARALAVALAAISSARGAAAAEVLPLVEHGLHDGQRPAAGDAGEWASAETLRAVAIAEADDRVVEAAEELAGEARRSGALIGTMTALGRRGWLYARRGDLVRAEAALRPLVDAGVEHDMQLLLSSSVWFLLDAILERSSLDGVAAMIEALDVDPLFLTTGGGAMFAEARGRLRSARGGRDAAIADLRACGTTYAALGFGPPFSFWRSALALALPAERRDEALALVEEEVARAVATGLRRPQGVALRAAGLVRGDDEGLERLRRSVALLAATRARLEHARSLVELGAALRRRGQRAHAREPLAAGMDLAYRCGAERLVARAYDELRAAGARPRRFVRTGIDALTTSERRTARLAATGRSNADVAQELFVSVKTVETHLSHAYAKLGLTGAGARRRLAAALEQARR